MRRRLDLPWRQTLSGVVVARGPDDTMLVTGIGAACWELLDRDRSTDDLLAAVSETYAGLDRPLDARELEEALLLLREEGLLVG